MFTGIIEHTGTIEALELTSEGGRVRIHAPTVAPSLAVSNSIAVNGCCLTIVDLHNGRLSADLSGETISKTSFGAKGGELKKGSRVNLEQPLTAGKDFGGHFVLGHVDTIGRVTHLTPEGENRWFAVEVPAEFARYVVPKGSITIDGISLTVARWQNNIAEVAVIAYTYEHTNIRDRKPGDAVNLEGDILGKYVERYLEARKELS
jgi:riboflavin synthase